MQGTENTKPDPLTINIKNIGQSVKVGMMNKVKIPLTAKKGVTKKRRRNPQEKNYPKQRYSRKIFPPRSRLMIAMQALLWKGGILGGRKILIFL
jgi:hypothetical protein